ncbi:uncharacterized protein EI90DRAFT_3248358 [Cantharellus anzutake]|uniref:uncharacterized protein n=1 Tax=Cantharellus anzutake TaxID=1750568 RepID=UPI00190744CE|nr:uncharacterized protein EI90DRAFT_3248358 [Cantharellus anzutake]KAF8339049.1 hypothetical protein EI90DRAFT_3248358 [Cantharellus anzutake]
MEGFILLLFLTAFIPVTRAINWPPLSAFIAPPGVPLLAQEYDGFELRWKRLVFRPAEFRKEGILFAFLILYLINYFIGKRTNSNRAYAWINAHTALYASQFSTPFSANEVVADGPTDLFGFSTGRRSVHYLHTVFTLKPRHDLFQLAYSFIRGLIELDFEPKDDITLDFKLRYDAAKGPGFVWAAVNKNHLKKLREDRWDLGVFTKTTDAIRVHPTVQIMTETADINQSVLTSGAVPSLLESLKNADALQDFKSLIVTDQLPFKPDTYDAKQPLPSLLTRVRHVQLTFKAPPTSRVTAADPIIRAAFELVDALGQLYGAIALPPNHPARSAVLQAETYKKLRNTRKEWDERLEKERTAEKLAELEENKRAEKKRLEDARISKLSATEQQRLLEKERKRALRRTAGKTTVKK